MRAEKRTRTIEVDEVTLSGLSEKHVQALRVALSEAIGERTGGDSHYAELMEIQSTLKELENKDDYWGR